MSALAARRAAALAQAQAQVQVQQPSQAPTNTVKHPKLEPTTIPTPTRSSSSKLNNAKSKAADTPTHGRKSQKATSHLYQPVVIQLDDGSDSQDESESSGSSVPAPTSPKRQKVRKSPPQARYFATATAKGDSSKRRRFSPSSPTGDAFPAESDNTNANGSANDSSDAESDDVLSADEYEAARDDVDEGRMNWSGSTPATPGASSIPGPSTRNRPLAQSSSSATTVTSNFEPIEGQNIQFVTEDDLRVAGLADGIPSPGALVSLGQGETLVLAGMYTLTPLQNPISLLSTTLFPAGSNHTSYPVFAPTSHPLPVLSPPLASASPRNITSDQPVSSNFLAHLSLPASFRLQDGRGKARSVFLLREHSCGLDGLRHGAVPGFAHVWLEERGSWGLRGVHPVVGSFPTPVYPYLTPSSWTTALSALPSSSYSQENDDEDPTTMIDTRSPLVALVKGPKRSGKSTFARAALNTLLGRYERVAWLECDLGQGEFGCGGLIGLWVVDRPQLGPPFTHPATPNRAHYLGTYTPLTCPDEYIAAIRQLVDYYKYEVQYISDFTSPSSSFSLRPDSNRVVDMIPLVVNTQGWVKGLGEELLRAIEIIAEPTHIFEFQSLDEEYITFGAGGGGATGGWTNSPPYQDSQLPYDQHNDPWSMSYGAGTAGLAVSADSTLMRRYVLEPAQTSPLQARYTPADLRVLSTITYFHAGIDASPSITTPLETARPSGSNPAPEGVRWDFSVPLLAQPPWAVELGENKAIDRVYMIGEGSEGVVPRDLGLALNGSVVALVEVLEGSNLDDDEDEDEDRRGDSAQAATPTVEWGKLYVQGRPPPSPENSTVLGLALIRAIRPADAPSSLITKPTETATAKSASFDIQLLTPLSAAMLRRCSAIIKNGAIELPLPGLMDWRISDSIAGVGGMSRSSFESARADTDAIVPFLDRSGIDVPGGERRRFRKNLMRKGM